MDCWRLSCCRWHVSRVPFVLPHAWVTLAYSFPRFCSTLQGSLLVIWLIARCPVFLELMGDGTCLFEPRLAHVVEMSCARQSRLRCGVLSNYFRLTMQLPCWSVAGQMDDWHQGTQLRYARKLLFATLVLPWVTLQSLPCL